MVKGYGVNNHIQQYFSYILTVSFISEGNQGIGRKPRTCRKPLTNGARNIQWLKLLANSWIYWKCLNFK